MTDLVITSARMVQQVEQAGVGYLDVPASEAIASGLYARLVPASGKGAIGNATTAGELGNFGGIATGGDVAAGDTVHIVMDGIVDVGDALDALDFDTLIYVSDTDGTFTDDALDATVDKAVAVVIGGWAFGNTADKLMRIFGNKP